MRILNIILGFLVLQCIAFAEADSADPLMNEPVTLNCTSMPLRDVLHEISNQIPASFVYNDPLVDGINVTYHVENGMLRDVLSYLIPGNKISYKLIENKLIVLFPNINDSRKFGQTENHFQEPELIQKSKPNYPVSAVRQNASGIVTLFLHITQKGDVDSVRLKSSSGFSLLDSTAIDYAATLQFKPALSNKKPVPIWMIWDFDFKIVDGQGSSIVDNR